MKNIENYLLHFCFGRRKIFGSVKKSPINMYFYFTIKQFHIYVYVQYFNCNLDILDIVKQNLFFSKNIYDLSKLQKNQSCDRFMYTS